MASKMVKITTISDVKDLINYTRAVDGDVLIKKGNYIVDGTSILGVLSLDMSTPVEIVYPQNALELEGFLNNFLA